MAQRSNKKTVKPRKSVSTQAVAAQHWPADKVERRSIADLIPYARNARTHSPEQIQQLVASMKEFGWTNPVLVDERGGIIAGHGRVLAALALEWSEVPVMVARGWTEAQKRAYVLADNQLAIVAEWDSELLAVELDELRDLGFALPLIGFAPGELNDLIGTPNTGFDPDETPPVPVDPVSRLGDLWLMGKHRLLCGDSTEAEDVIRVMGAAVADIAICDAPYGISVVKGGTVGGAKPFGREHGRAKNAIIEPGVYAPIIGDDTTETAIKGYGVLVELGIPVIVMWGGNYFANALPPSRCWLVWDKETTGNFSDAELAWTNQDRVVELLRHQWSGLIKASEHGERRTHPTQKPVVLAEWVIETLAPHAEIVLDPFLGSGWTLLACERKGRKCFSVELAPAYVDVSVLRWQQFTGKEATLEQTGQTFQEVTIERQKAESGVNERSGAITSSGVDVGSAENNLA